MRNSFLSRVHSVDLPTQPSFWFIFNKEEILLHRFTLSINVPFLATIDQLNLPIEQQQYFGLYDGVPCFAAKLKQDAGVELPLDMFFEPIKKAVECLDHDLFFLISRAKQILHWNAKTQFCGCCGQLMQMSLTESAKECLICHNLVFPPISPVVLVLVCRDKKVLLARSPHFPEKTYSILAGFVEVGETLEDCVRREVREEVGIEIKNLQYFCSQPWPFPSNLMIGFSAEYESGELICDSREIEDAQWFSWDQLPELPSIISLSRQMIEAHFRST